MEERAAKVHINAWSGGETAVSGDLAASATGWVHERRFVEHRPSLAPAPPADPAAWRNPQVGWGLVLPYRKGVSTADLASGADAPEPIRRLLAARAPAPVFRYVPASPHRFTHLRSYQTQQDIAIAGSPRGVAPSALPSYILIAGSPAEIPWDLQYVLNPICCTGRLDLDEGALDRYVTALLDDWSQAGARVTSSVVWAVDHGTPDITELMRKAIAEKLHALFAADADLKDGTVFLNGAVAPATAAGLVQALGHHRPALVVSTSHGQTGPLDQLAVMAAKLGAPVDQTRQTLDMQTLLASWQPDGAIWYAHACCSAGSDGVSIYRDLFQVGSDIRRVLEGVAALGALTAPMPKALLGAPKPARGFIGQVEPTFDWTLRQPATGQYLTAALEQALYHRLYRSMPVGLAFRQWYEAIGSLYVQYEAAKRAFDRGEDTERRLLYCQLAARDLQSTVLLGDPTVTLPALS